MDTRQEPPLAQVVEILANGLGADLEAGGQVLHAHASIGARERDDVVLAGGERGHGRVCPAEGG